MYIYIYIYIYRHTSIYYIENAQKPKGLSDLLLGRVCTAKSKFDFCFLRGEGALPPDPPNMSAWRPGLLVIGPMDFCVTQAMDPFSKKYCNGSGECYYQRTICSLDI